ncbi:DNA repair protein RecO (recombination protein O) [Weissella uvarum]|uniref:DNA repair protein RecO n=1 Tax=Weissella uvarum TaxID=1479233 RepID=UPI0019616904|nr:DNA repair protein RecO [Weissella uvarum]MBM7618096.1 DNA repair protein RecO (recombination protein O) [Weissella uvarum]MCM0595917.1 DNA repair protein RecO [Weissella uvarum]
MADIFNGLVIYQRPHKETDLMVKILTREFGKRMFYVRHGKAKHYQYAADIQPLTSAKYEGTINKSGLSFINDVKESHLPRIFLEDVEKNAYMTYILGLIDAAYVDNQPIPQWFDLAQTAEDKMVAGFDAQALANYFEIHLLPDFGIQLEWQACVVCGQTTGPMDFSEKYHGVLCQNHWSVDEYRMQMDPKALHVLQQLARVELKQIHSLDLKPATKREMARLLDKLYEEQVGVQLRAKGFIHDLHKWDQRLAQRKDKSQRTD